MSNPNQPWKRNYQTLPTFKLKWADGFGVPAGKVAAPLERRIKSLPTLKMEWDAAPPVLRLEFELRPNADPLEATQAIRTMLDVVSKHYQSIGGTGLGYNPDQIRDSSTNGLMRVDLVPLESGDNAVLRGRLQQVERTIAENGCPAMPVTCIRSRVA